MFITVIMSNLSDKNKKLAVENPKHKRLRK